LSDRILSFVFDQPAPQRLDKFLVTCVPDLSRSRLQGLIEDGFVTVDGVPAHKSGQMVATEATIEVHIPPVEPSELIPEAIPLDIVYEDDNLIVVNKPAGMVVHPAAGHATGTLVHAALAHAPQMTGIGGEKRPGVVHRLDKDTSGLILLAKNDQTHHFLQDQFRLRKTVKVYMALVDGHPPTAVGRIEAAIGRSQVRRKQMAVTRIEKGREAVSEYKTLESFPNHDLLEVRPLTGRTHQIRLHLAFLGCPVAGDRVYGHKRTTVPLERHFLHAARLTIRLLNEKEPRTFDAPLPSELADVLENLRRNQ
jgi:23S rRNA pseudouridine1911/1915/1917 synthase